MISAKERNDSAPTRRFTRKLQRSFIGIGAGRPRALQLVFPATGTKQIALERLQETSLHTRMKVQTQSDATRAQILNEGIAHARIVVTVIQRLIMTEDDLTKVFDAFAKTLDDAAAWVKAEGMQWNIHGPTPNRSEALYI